MVDDNIAQFIPPAADNETIDKDTWREAVTSLRPDISDEEIDEGWAGFVAMKLRVENPRRRMGGDVRRKGPVLFPPCHYVRDVQDEGPALD